MSNYVLIQQMARHPIKNRTFITKWHTYDSIISISVFASNSQQQQQQNRIDRVKSKMHFAVDFEAIFL